MANESMKMGEGFHATVKRAGGEPPDPKPRHYWIGWALIASLLGGAGYGGHAWMSQPSSPMLAERAGVTETLKHKIGGVLNVSQIRGGQDSLSITEALTHFLSRAQADTVVLTESLTPLTIPSGGGSGPSSASFVGSAAPSGHAGLFAFSMTASGWWGSSTHTSGGGWIGANTL